MSPPDGTRGRAGVDGCLSPSRVTASPFAPDRSRRTGAITYFGDGTG